MRHLFGLFATPYRIRNKTGSVGASSSFPLYPSKQTSTVAAATSYRLRQCPPNSCGVRLSRGGGHAQLQFWPPVWSAIDRRTGCRPNPNGPRPSICVWRDELPAAAADQISLRCLAIFLNGSLSVFALRRTAKMVRFRASAIVPTLFALRTSARSLLSCSGVQGARGVPFISPSPSA